MDAGWSSEQVEGFCTVHGESDGGAAGFYWGADGSRDPFWWSGGGGLRLAATFATLGANGLHIHQLVPQSRAQMGELPGSSVRRGPERRAWTQTPRCLAAPPFGPPDERAAEATAEEEEAAEEEPAAEEEELLLGFI